MKIELRGEIRFPDPGYPNFGGILFSQFAPIEDLASTVRLGRSHLDVRLEVDPEKHNAKMGDDLRLEDVENRHSLRFVGLYVYLSTDVDDDLGSALRENRSHPDLRQLGERIAHALETIHDSLIEFARHDVGQFWLPPRWSPKEPLNQRLLHYETRVRTSEGWRIMTVHKPEQPEVSVTTYPGINGLGWQMFLDGLAQRGQFRARSYRHLIANAFSHLGNHDLRAAIIEAVAAWEIMLVGKGFKILARHVPDYSHSEWKKLIKRAGLRAPSNLFFALVKVDGLEEHSATLLSGLELRNAAVHDAKRSFDQQRVRSFLLATRSVIDICEHALDA